jgi:NTE family protein
VEASSKRDRQVEALAPVEAPEEKLEDGIALCLSGGGYRAMLFHVGAVWRLNELGYLPRLDRVSSVSGGSIAAAVLAKRWDQLRFEDDGVAANLTEQFVAPVRGLAGKTIDRGSVLGGIFTRSTVAEKVASAYRKHLLGKTGLHELPIRPRFVFNATSVQTGALWRFSRPYMADRSVGVIPEPRIELAVAVAASSAFPPVLSPLRLKLESDAFQRDGRGPPHREPFTTEAVLSDGGVYDNLGLETAWKRYRTLLVSDGGGQLAPDSKPRVNWAHHAVRIASVVDHQVRNLRKRQVIAGFTSGERKGTYWGIRSDVGHYHAPGGACPVHST